jgi:hypothetical protein
MADVAIYTVVLELVLQQEVVREGHVDVLAPLIVGGVQ